MVQDRRGVLYCEVNIYKKDRYPQCGERPCPFGSCIDQCVEQSVLEDQQGAPVDRNEGFAAAFGHHVRAFFLRLFPVSGVRVQAEGEEEKYRQAELDGERGSAVCDEEASHVKGAEREQEQYENEFSGQVQLEK